MCLKLFAALLAVVSALHQGALAASGDCPDGPPDDKPPYFFEDEPLWGQSEMRKHLIRMYNETCKDEACGLHEAMSHFVSAYREMKQVLVVDITNWDRNMNGIGKNIVHWVAPLFHSLRAGRPAFIHRNPHGCGRDCLFDPADYFGLVGNVEWRWTREAECYVRRLMAARGVGERVFTVVTAADGDRSRPTGVRDDATGEHIAMPGFVTLTFLQHPAVRAHPWVRLRFQPSSPGAARNAVLLGMHSVLRMVGEAPDGEGRRNAEAAERDAARQACPGAPEGTLLRVEEDCAMGVFFYPLPRLQRLVAPKIPMVDAVRRACGSVVGLHFRSGYADIAADPPWRELGKRPLPARVTHEAVIRRAWGALHALTAPCPRRCHLGKPPDPNGGYATDPTPGCAPAGSGEGTPCVDWENNDRILAVVTDLRKELLKAMLSEDNGQDASPPDPAASPPAFAPFSFDHTEVGHAFGLVPAAFTTAARAAQALASDPSGRAACLAARGEEGRPAGASSGEEEAWALFVASDAPIVVAMAEASPSLQGHAFTAGNASGTIGNVWMQALCKDSDLREGNGICRDETARREVDPGGAWSRSAVDLFLLTQTDLIYALGFSSFAGAASRLRLNPVPGKQTMITWGFQTQVTTEGKYLPGIKPDVEWGSERWRQVTEAMTWLEAAGLSAGI